MFRQTNLVRAAAVAALALGAFVYRPVRLVYAQAPAPPRPAPVRPPPAPLSRKDELPPLSYVCPMAQDAEIVDAEAGACRKCGMALVPARLETAWSCPVHQDVMQAGPGKCPIDKRDLVQITASEFWACRNAPDQHFLEPGSCADGTARVRTFERRPHGDHNPRHGGQFFMADDNWHHLEGTLRAGGVFRVYFYNDFTQPIPSKGITGEVVVVDARDKEAGPPIRLRQGAVSNALDAPIAGAKLPLAVRLRLKFAPTEKERLFDFAFTAASRELVAGRPDTRSTLVPPSPNTPTPPPVAPPPLPTTVTGLVSELVKQRDGVAAALGRGALTDVWYPAFTAKDVALALQNHESELPEVRRGPAASAVNRLVLTAWQIDSYGDLGDKQKLNEAFRVFAAAVEEIRAAYDAPR